MVFFWDFNCLVMFLVYNYIYLYNENYYHIYLTRHAVIKLEYVHVIEGQEQSTFGSYCMCAQILPFTQTKILSS